MTNPLAAIFAEEIESNHDGEMHTLAERWFDLLIAAAEASDLTPAERAEFYTELGETCLENSDTAPPDEELFGE